jgi:hypothetical protein
LIKKNSPKMESSPRPAVSPERQFNDLDAPADENRSPQTSPQRAGLSRASYLSPTKSTLAKFNPELLKRAATTSKRGNAQPLEGAKDSLGNIQRASPRSVRTTTRSLARNLLQPATSTVDDPFVTGPVHSQSQPETAFTIEGTSKRDLRRRKEGGATPKIASSPSQKRQEVVEDGPETPTPLERQVEQPIEKPAEEQEKGTESDDGEPELPPSRERRRKDGDHLVPLVNEKETPRARARRLRLENRHVSSSPGKPKQVTPRKRKDIPLEMSEQSSPKRRLLIELRAQVATLEEEVEALDRAVAEAAQQSLSKLKERQRSDELVNGLLESNDVSIGLKPKTGPAKVNGKPRFSLTAFLPFSKPKRPTVPIPSELLGPLPSHRPLKLDNPLPHLQVFTPLTINSVTKLLPQSSSGDIFQKHSMTLASSQHLLSASLDLTVNNTKLSVASLSLKHISSWADPELSLWTAKQCTERNIAHLCYGIGEYTTHATHRAKTWYALETEFPYLLSQDRSHRSSMPFLKKWGKANIRKEQRQRRGSTVSDDFPPHSMPTSPVDTDRLKRRDLMPHLGRRNLLFASSAAKRDVAKASQGPRLLVSWEIELDTTATAHDRIGIAPVFPTFCKFFLFPKVILCF